MNRRAVALVIALAVLIVGGVGIYALTRPETASTSAQSDPQRPPASSIDTPGAGSYVDYSDTAIASAEGTTLLFFHAPWCPQCRSIESDIIAEGVPAGVTVIKVDYDSHQDLRQKYEVTLQTTFVEVDSNGDLVQSYVAYEDPRFQAVVDAML
jgi:thiol-disulfide isomerase/thioredoxin